MTPPLHLYAEKLAVLGEMKAHNQLMLEAVTAPLYAKIKKLQYEIDTYKEGRRQPLEEIEATEIKKYECDTCGQGFHGTLPRWHFIKKTVHSNVLGEYQQDIPCHGMLKRVNKL